jgi:hypothetical protein
LKIEGSMRGRLMNSNLIGWSLVGLSLAGALLVAGCSSNSAASQSRPASEGAQFLLDAEPESAIGILEYRELETPPQEVVLWGKIGGGKQVWSPSTAEFMLTDPTFELDAGGHVCTSDNCPFCKGKDEKDKAQAIVSLVDHEGKVPAVEARKLLPLEEGQMVVVRGQAEVNSLGLLVVRAQGVYVR